VTAIRAARPSTAVVRHVLRIDDLLGLTANDEDHRRVLAVVRYPGRDG
jgi:hypothetical protein